jgi:hypothetical protein
MPAAAELASYAEQSYHDDPSFTPVLVSVLIFRPDSWVGLTLPREHVAALAKLGAEFGVSAYLL